jgi:vanillate O-demethylase ferredoxin subunit
MRYKPPDRAPYLISYKCDNDLNGSAGVTFSDPGTLNVLVKSIVYEAEGINSYDLRPADGEPLPSFTAGAHIDLHLPSGLIRSYSLLNSQDERHRYVIAVNKDAASRGGSRHIHEVLRPGDRLVVTPPRNNFPLTEDASQSIFFGGGIGVTPFLSMIRRLGSLERSWQLFYGVRNRNCASFLDTIQSLAEVRNAPVHVNFDRESGRILDIASLVATAAPGAHLYCCGPIPMIEAFEKAAADRPPETIHVEYFSAKEAPAADGGFTVILARSGKTLQVPAGKTILQAVVDAGIDAPHSCLEGVCGACETRVLEGIPDHRDLVLSRDDHAANKSMMICCSGSKTERLVLDI